MTEPLWNLVADLLSRQTADINALRKDRDYLMARIDDLASNVAALTSATASILAANASMANKVTELEAQLAAPREEDPRIGEAADAVAAAVNSIRSIVPSV